MCFSYSISLSWLDKLYLHMYPFGQNGLVLLEFNVSLSHIETMPAREINPFTALTRIRSQFLRTQWSTSNHQRVDMVTPQTAQPSGLAGHNGIQFQFNSITLYSPCIFVHVHRCFTIKWVKILNRQLLNHHARKTILTQEIFYKSARI